MDSGAWWATVHGVAKSWTQLKRFSTAHGPLYNSGSSLELGPDHSLLYPI